MSKTRVCIVLAFGLAGCAEIGKAALQVPPGPPAFREGYAAGCKSGWSAGGDLGFHFTKDPARYAADSLYRQGWDNGFQICGTKAVVVNTPGQPRQPDR